jgi:hypothetical protein
MGPLKNLFLQNHCFNFNQAWHKLSLEDDDSRVFKGMGITPLQGEIIAKE